MPTTSINTNLEIQKVCLRVRFRVGRYKRSLAQYKNNRIKLNNQDLLLCNATYILCFFILCVSCIYVGLMNKMDNKELNPS